MRSPFHPRCPRAIDVCKIETPAFTDGVACHLALGDFGWLERG
jgi:hypothetical protein